MATNFQRTPGESEATLAPRSGLRRKDFTLHLASNQTFNVAALAVGSTTLTGTSSATSATTMTDGTATWITSSLVGLTVTTNGKTGVITSNTKTTLTVASWTGGTPASGNTYTIPYQAWSSLTLANQQNPFFGTLVALVTQGSPASGKTIQIRVRGFDQFGQYQEELTPVIAVANKTNTYVYLAKCFSHITAIHYRSSTLTIATDTLSIGTRWDWTRTIDATNDHQYGRNLGIPIPVRLGRRPFLTKSTRRQFQQPNGIGPAAVDGGVTPSVAPNSLVAYDSYAKGYLLINATPSNTETVTIDSTTYTFKTTITSTAGDVLIGADAAASAVNLAAAINAQGGSGTLYGSSTTAHTTVRAIGSDGGAVLVIARTPGAAGNVIATTETLAGSGSIWSSGSTLKGGYDAPVEVLSVTVQDQTGGASSGAITVHSHRDFAVGWQVAGWSCPIEKIHFLSQSIVAQWAITDNIFVRMTVLSGETAAG